MPLVKMLKTAAGPLGTFISGSRAHVDDETAEAWIAAGAAEAVEAPVAAGAPEPEAKAEPKASTKKQPKDTSESPAATAPPASAEGSDKE